MGGTAERQIGAAFAFVAFESTDRSSTRFRDAEPNFCAGARHKNGSQTASERFAQ